MTVMCPGDGASKKNSFSPAFEGVRDKILTYAFKFSHCSCWIRWRKLPINVHLSHWDPSRQRVSVLSLLCKEKDGI